MELGVSKNDGRIFTGRSFGGHELSPMPMVSPCKLVLDKVSCATGPKADDPITNHLFLEDFFDPKSRIRRGRIYKAYGSQPHRWRLRDGSDVECETYGRCSVWAEYLRNGAKHLYVLLGDETRFTVWKLVDLEVIATAEEMVTLKALTSYGLLPELLESAIPTIELHSVRKALDQVVDETYTASADSVVDCCREAASTVLGAFLERPHKDLGKLVGLLDQEPHKRRLAHKCAGIINDLHPRRKASELRGRGLRPLCDDDAQLAVQCLGAILVEIEWGRW